MSGSATLVGWLLRHGLLDQLDLLVFPLVVGSGKRLFSESDGQVPSRSPAPKRSAPAWCISVMRDFIRLRQIVARDLETRHHDPHGHQ